ncbi:TAXI family TRAP transporter solute-binding subunit [Candidatus Albibeggiatoa sp. nov. BB20]|uniref:TAXI family TRAP transporter solute-binding subunit n=1 Tax=Candidatus Albibeggiatoa sp. nov. BB20 TaxID=3162723 RepID=UPI0033654864
MKKLNQYMLTGFLLLFSTNSFALDEIKIGAGGASGEYTNTIVPALNKALTDYGYRARAVISAGSQANIDKVLSGELPAGLSQLDVAALNMTPEKDPDEKLVLLGKIAPEALFCAARKEGKINSYHDITDEQATPLKVSVGREDSGTAKTFQFLMNIDPELNDSKVKLYHRPNVKVELNRLISGRRDLVCFVMSPNPDNERIEMVMKSEELIFITIDEPAFAEAKFSGANVYDILEVPVSGGILGFNQTKVKTLVTWVGIVVNESQADEKLLDALSTVAMRPDLLPEGSLAGKATRLFNSLRDIVQ